MYELYHKKYIKMNIEFFTEKVKETFKIILDYLIDDMNEKII